METMSVLSNNLKRMTRLYCIIFMLFSVLSLSACATMNSVKESASDMGTSIKHNLTKDGGKFEISVAGGITYFNNAKIHLGDKRVNIAANRPLIESDPAPTALFVPLGLVQSSLDHLPISYGVSRILWQQFLGEQTFTVLELANTPPPYRVDLAIPMARAMGANYLIGGYITHFFDGGSSGDSKIALQFEIYDTQTGALMWSIDQTGVLPKETDRDNVFFKVKNRMPVDAMSTLIAAMGKDIATYLHYWTDFEGMQEKERQAQSGKKSNWDPSAFGKY